MTVAAVAAVAFLGVLVAFQVALALGAPWGSAAWGGRHPGVLPTRFRVASAVAGLVVYPLIIGLVLSAAGWISPPWLRDLGSLPMWVLAGVFALGTLANGISRSPRERVWAPVALALAVCCVILAVGAADADARRPTRLAAPAPGEVRPDYLADGTPVWVVGHADGTVSVLTGLDAHRPSVLGLLWWCETAGMLESPSYGSMYDEHGARIGGPAPAGLAPYDVTVVGDVVRVGAVQEPPGWDEPSSRPPPGESERCHGPDSSVVYHTFDGWTLWDSPSAALEAKPAGWILLEGTLVVEGDGVNLCALRGCADRALAAGIPAVSDAEIALGHLSGERFIAHVRDDVLVNVTRVIHVPRVPQTDGD